jgi:hypothetical protein
VTHEAATDTWTHEADRCSARTSAGRPCRAHPIRGGTVCRVHGGMAPQVRAAAERRLEARRIDIEAGRLMGQVGTDAHPVEHLLTELYRSAAVVEVLGAELDHVTVIDDRGSHPLYRAWSEERQRHADLAALALRAGVEERRVRLAEQQAQLVVTVIRGALVDLGVDPDSATTRQVLRTHLELATTGGSDHEAA